LTFRGLLVVDFSRQMVDWEAKKSISNFLFVWGSSLIFVSRFCEGYTPTSPFLFFNSQNSRILGAVEDLPALQEILGFLPFTFTKALQGSHILKPYVIFIRGIPLPSPFLFFKISYFYLDSLKKPLQNFWNKIFWAKASQQFQTSPIQIQFKVNPHSHLITIRLNHHNSCRM
jgi:hypothetical protein